MVYFFHVGALLSIYATFPFHLRKQKGPAKNIARMKLKQVYGPFLVCGVGPDQIRKQGPVPMQCERLDR